MNVRKTVLILGAMAMVTLSASQNAQAGQCRDPWVTQAIQQVTGRAPNADNESGECSIRNFNNGSWGSYPELLGYVQSYFNRGRVARVPAADRQSLRGDNNSARQLADSVRNNGANGIVAAGGGNAMDRRNNLIGDGGGT